MAEKPESGFVLFQGWVGMGQEQEETKGKVISLGAGSSVGFGYSIRCRESRALGWPDLVLSWGSVNQLSNAPSFASACIFSSEK